MKRVLIIEDDLDAANVLEAYLKRDQFQTSSASSGNRGLELAFSWKPDIILLDVMLPGMSGNDVLLALRRRSDIPVIMITAIRDGSDKISALRFGADDYVVKPITRVRWSPESMLYSVVIPASAAARLLSTGDCRQIQSP